jgi:hypothetical protein
LNLDTFNMSAPVKVFGCRPIPDGATASEGRRTKTSKGGNRGREGGDRTALELRRLERCDQGPGILNGCRPRMGVQLERYGTDIAKWGK